MTRSAGSKRTSAAAARATPTSPSSRPRASRLAADIRTTHVGTAGTPDGRHVRPRLLRAAPAHRRAEARGCTTTSPPRTQEPPHEHHRTARRLHARSHPGAGEAPTDPTPTIPLAKALNAGLAAAMAADDQVLLMGEDIGRLGGVFRVTEGLQERLRRRARAATPPSPSRASSAPRSASPCAVTAPSIEIQFDGFIWPGVRPDHVAAREDGEPAARRTCRCRS